MQTTFASLEYRSIWALDVETHDGYVEMKLSETYKVPRTNDGLTLSPGIESVVTKQEVMNMKETIKTSRTAGYLEKIFRSLKRELF